MEICVNVFSDRVAFWLLACKYMKKMKLNIMIEDRRLKSQAFGCGSAAQGIGNFG
jgi:hypothetical protein